MSGLLRPSPSLSWVSVTNLVLLACIITLLIMYLVRAVMRSRAGGKVPRRIGLLHRILVVVVATVLAIGYLSFSAIGMFTDRPLLSQIGDMFLGLAIIYLLALGLWRIW